MGARQEREFDIVLFGATGFTGKLVAQYLVEGMRDGSEHFRLALAGRSAAKLADVAKSIQAPALTQIEADSFDEESLRQLARRARVIVSTVGPYCKYGAALVAACAEAGTHYCDLTGEVLFVRQMMDAHDQTAKKSGARIVHCCGYDSMPSDLGTLFLQEEWHKLHGDFASEIAVGAGETKGSFSGGTVSTMLHVFELASKDSSIRKLIEEPYALCAPDGAGEDGPDQLGVGYSKALRSWTAPFIMAGINTRVVRRSHALLGHPWGENFRYMECMAWGKGLKGLVMSLITSVGLITVMILLFLPFSRRLLTPRLPQPGDGPNEAARRAGFFNTHVVGTKGQRRLEALVSGELDPGYGCTAIMLSEAALCLSQNEEQLPSQGGILTPATAMGRLLIERLQKAGLQFRLQ